MLVRSSSVIVMLVFVLVFCSGGPCRSCVFVFIDVLVRLVVLLVVFVIVVVSCGLLLFLGFVRVLVLVRW